MIQFEMYPNWVWFLIFCTLSYVMFLYLRSKRWRTKKIEEAGDINLIRHLFSSISFRKRKIKTLLILSALLMGLIALAGPKYSDETVEIKREGVDILFLLDVSNSMLAQDIQPNRMEKAKLEIKKIVRNLKGDRVGLVIFAGQAYLQTPLTLDYAAFELLLDLVSPNMISVQGTSFTEAISRGMSSYETEENGNEHFKTMILISDGEDHEGALDEITKEAKLNHVIVHTVGIGSARDTPVPQFNKDGKAQGYRKDRNGNIVTSRLNMLDLIFIAEETNGISVQIESGNGDLNLITDSIFNMDKKSFSAKEFVNYKEQYHWFAWLYFILLLLEMSISDYEKRLRSWEGQLIE